MTVKHKKTGVIIAAGGSGKRMGGKDKLYRVLDGIPVLARSALAFQRHPRVDEIVFAVREGTADICRKEIIEKYELSKVCAVVTGGAERALSVRAALTALPEDCAVILIQDGARPLADPELIDRVIDAAARRGAAIPVIPVKDTVKYVQTGEDGVLQIAGTPDRSTLRAVQTPQGFSRDILFRAYGLDEASRESTGDIEDRIRRATDDASLAEALGVPVAAVEGSEDNLKITTPGDLEQARRILGRGKAETMLRIGTGYDVHAFAEGRPLILGGVEIPHDRGLAGHSDADVLVHAIMDALLGACALGDIGQHFPDSDPRYKGISSILLLKHVRDLLEEKGWRIGNVDSIVIAQKPKLAGYIETMRGVIADALNISTDCVSVKATTTEHLGFTGREEGIAAQAAASVVRVQEEE
ncbi:MAG: 2-C-methyl-D-erythritol 2,4-cyclodiphosphate synthase [Firmicutes bacterium]|nr:2-C-methyl-D-erythritol 2,4-cyclodiphosphate synthase [Bacillota bacterium]